jgi:intein/homing endonuclease
MNGFADSNASRKYSLNESFFDEWSAAMAYVLGFWFADGYMRHDKSYRVSFTSNDIQILKDIRRVMGSTNPIYKTKRDNSSYVVLHSKKLFERLIVLGGMQRKSRFIRFPEIPQEYIKDFVRGYFDGDGSVFLSSTREQKMEATHGNCGQTSRRGAGYFSKILCISSIKKLICRSR